MSAVVLFWLVFAIVLLMALTGARRTDARVVICGLFGVLAVVGLIG